MKRLGVYCGSFAPLHNGHIRIFREVVEKGLCDKVIVVPTGNYWDKVISVPLDIRVACLKLFEDEKTIIDDDINDNESANTFTLFENLKKKYPDYDLALIIGADNLLKFEYWYNAKELMDNYHFIIMNRDEIDTISELNRLGKTNYSIIECPKFNVSSSYIRENYNNPKKLEGLVDSRVLDIIKNVKI